MLYYVLFSISYMGCHPSHWRSHICPSIYWLVVWNMNFIVPFSWECHHPNWRTPSFFQDGRYTTNQIIILRQHILPPGAAFTGIIPLSKWCKLRHVLKYDESSFVWKAHTPHSTHHTLHCTLHTLHFTLYTLHYTPRTLQFTNYILLTPHFTLSSFYTPHAPFQTL